MLVGSFSALCIVYIVIFATHTLVFLVAQTCSNLRQSDSLEPQIFHLELQVSGIDAFIHLHFNIAHHVMMAQEEVELHQHHVMISGFHVFHVALKFQYLHTSAMYFCAGYIEDPWGCGRKSGNKGARKQHCICGVWGSWRFCTCGGCR